ncbi:protein-tyrosine phosphatase-like protein [Vararia minispora EC-137]|uniref:Protein-tyrosine phosphatase-like protein n=1 Tax=Vararia minispora EC-137 TaxID=1314806 RepID=A0ACB8QRI6_9AGAM|nr:protein-tyrosine phosphatase-like protein [Vararia minispora EC-137]
MDAIRVSKVTGVVLHKGPRTSTGTLHLTAHHIIFSYDGDSAQELWVPYPLINLVTRLPQTFRGRCPISFRCRNFELFSLYFDKESDAIDVFESVKELTVAISVTQLYAFFYTPNPSNTASDGWTLYSPREEFGRMGVGTRSKAWRYTDINKDYEFCPTYPARLVVPTRISDTTLQYAVKYRSKGRIPALTYLHWANYGSITRSSQPMVGLTNSRSIQDEKLIEAIFQSHYSPESRAASAPIFGATAANLIIDARPTANAMANTAKGAGTENMDYYKDCRKAYLGIDNIHAMRDSLTKVVEALRDAEALAASVGEDSDGNTVVLPVDRQALRKSGWLRHISAILEGSLVIVRNVHIKASHVLIHCSDGWDRTSQLSAISQLCLDPFYRTLRGFQVLVEKDWVSFGHRFLDRCGHLSSDKFFIASPENTGGGGGAEAAQAFFASVQNRFASNHHLKETSPVFHQFLEAVRNIQRQYPERFEFDERFLRDLHYHLYSCQFGTFLFNSEKERRECVPSLVERTTPIWDFINSEPRRTQYINPDFKPELDDPSRRERDADQGVLLPNPRDVRFWNELYGRGDEEMNGRYVAQLPQGVELTGPVENAEDDPAVPHLKVLRDSPSPITPLATLPPVPPTPPLATAKSMVELGTPPSARAESLPQSKSQFLSSPSSSSLRPSHEQGRQRTLPLSPSSSSLSQPDFLSSAGGGLRSMWGKLSSNASNAFSAVQDAYGGLANDLRGLNLGAGPSSGSLSSPVGGGGELRGHEELPAWGGQPTEAPRRGTFSTGSGFASNPWATTSTRPPRHIPSIYDENPWGTKSTRTTRSFDRDPLITFPNAYVKKRSVQ